MAGVTVLRRKDEQSATVGRLGKEPAITARKQLLCEHLTVVAAWGMAWTVPSKSPMARGTVDAEYFMLSVFRSRSRCCGEDQERCWAKDGSPRLDAFSPLYTFPSCRFLADICEQPRIMATMSL